MLQALQVRGRRPLTNVTEVGVMSKQVTAKL